MIKYIIVSLFIFSSLFAEVEKEEETQETRLESLTKYTNIINIVERYYVDDIKLQEIVNKSIKGLMNELDAHSGFLDEKEFKELNIKTKGEFGGLGIVVGIREGALTIISPIDDTPAYRAGVKAGDLILKIDDKPTLELKLDEAVKLMRGKPNTKITLTIVRKGETKPIKIEIVRDIIKTVSTNYKTYEDKKYLYLRVSSFDANVRENLEKYIKENKETKGIILDLRNNPGGLLTQAINVVDMFVKEGVIVSQKGRDEDSKEEYKATEELISDVPLVVLVNGGSASASEIVSGAIQDLKRGVVIGEKTFGKGSVQSVIPIGVGDKKEGMKLTIAKYYLPSGRTIQAKGVKPDIEVYSGKVLREEESEFKLKEKDMKNHLEEELKKVEEKEETNLTEELEKDVKDLEKMLDKNVKKENKHLLTKEDLENDNQLNTAINILKVLILTK